MVARPRPLNNECVVGSKRKEPDATGCVDFNEGTLTLSFPSSHFRCLKHAVQHNVDTICKNTNQRVHRMHWLCHHDPVHHFVQL